MEKNNKENSGKDMEKQVQKLNLSVIILMMLLLGAVFFTIVRFFVVPVILAATFTTLFYPLFRWMLKKLFKGNRTLTSAACCIVLTAGVFIPAYLIVHLMVLQSIDIYQSSEQFVKQIVQGQEEFPPEMIVKHPLFINLHLDAIDWQGALREVVRSSGKVLTNVVNKTSAGAFEIIAGIFLTLFTMFYFFRDGESFMRRLRFLSPLRPSYEEMIISRFVLMARATIKGTVIIGFTQGIMGALLLLFLGFKTWLLWGVVMIVLSIIPIVGSYFILVPAAVYLFFSGQITNAVIAVIVATLLNYGVDYIMRPRLVGHDSKVHDLIIFFSTLGGLAVFGVMGFVVGPVIAMLFVTLIDIYASEFKNQLIAANEDNRDDKD